MPVELTASQQVYQLKITLRGSKPPIWRRVLVQGDTTLARLHSVIQVVMPWANCHFHEFRVKGKYYGRPDDECEDDATINEKMVAISRVLKSEGDRMVYVYDFGDDWQHSILVEKIAAPDNKARYPVCTGGRLACPPDNSGSMWGYYNKLEVLKHPEHPEYENIREWLGRNWDSEHFDADAVNAALQRLPDRTFSP